MRSRSDRRGNRTTIRNPKRQQTKNKPPTVEAETTVKLDSIPQNGKPKPVGPRPGGFFSQIPKESPQDQPQMQSQPSSQSQPPSQSYSPNQNRNQSQPALKSIPVSQSAEFVIPQPKTIIPQDQQNDPHQHDHHASQNPTQPKLESIPQQKQPSFRQMQQKPQQNMSMQQSQPTRPRRQHQSSNPGRGKMELMMTEAMKVLKQDIGPLMKKKKTPKKKIIQERNKAREQMIPESLNDILKNIARIDSSIEASALVDVQGSLLASAVSRRISEYLISTIANTLGNIGTDIINSLESGDLEFATLHGTEGILFLAPIMKNIFLMLLTGPEAKIGIINVAKIRVKKQLELFFAKKNLKKTPV